MSTASTDEPLGLSPVGGAMELPPDAEPPARRDHRWGRFLDWSGTSAPVAVLLLAGIGLGPRGISLLSVDTLALLAPAIPVAVAALGVLVGLSIAVGRTDEGRIVLPAGLDALVTLLVVSAGMASFAASASPSWTRPMLVVVAGAGLCAASSLTLPTGNPLEPRPVAVRLVELGVLVPIVLGSGMLAWVHAQSAATAAVSIAQAAGLICALAVAAWLLLSVATNETEERVLTVSALLLVGGVSDALSTSALFGGLVAGSLWRAAGGRPLLSIGRDVLFVQHPLVVGLLLTAGASAELSRTTLIYAAVYVVVRVAGRLAGGFAARRVPGADMPPDLISHLLPPGVFGVAFALNAAGVLGDDGSVLLGAVVLGTIGSEILAILLSSRRAAA